MTTRELIVLGILRKNKRILSYDDIRPQLTALIGDMGPNGYRVLRSLETKNLVKRSAHPNRVNTHVWELTTSGLTELNMWVSAIG